MTPTKLLLFPKLKYNNALDNPMIIFGLMDEII